MLYEEMYSATRNNTDLRQDISDVKESLQEVLHLQRQHTNTSNEETESSKVVTFVFLCGIELHEERWNFKL